MLLASGEYILWGYFPRRVSSAAVTSYAWHIMQVMRIMRMRVMRVMPAMQVIRAFKDANMQAFWPKVTRFT